jgi:hypothetical protein
MIQTFPLLHQANVVAKIPEFGQKVGVCRLTSDPRALGPPVGEKLVALEGTRLPNFADIPNDSIDSASIHQDRRQWQR